MQNGQANCCIDNKCYWIVILFFSFVLQSAHSTSSPFLREKVSPAQFGQIFVKRDTHLFSGILKGGSPKAGLLWCFCFVG